MSDGNHLYPIIEFAEHDEVRVARQQTTFRSRQMKRKAAGPFLYLIERHVECICKSLGGTRAARRVPLKRLSGLPNGCGMQLNRLRHLRLGE